MRVLIAVGLLISSGVALASDQKGITDECLAIKDNTERLACYDQVLKRPTLGEINETVVKPIPAISFRVLQKGDYDNFAKADVTAKPATFDIQEKDGQDTSRVKFAVVAVSAALNDVGWQSFGSVTWDRDATGDVSKRKDLRDIGVGVTGTLLQTNDLEWSLYTTARYRHRQDLYGALDGNATGLHASIVKLDWVDGKPFIFIPYVGLLLDKRNGGGNTEGQWNSAYLGASLKFPLNNWVRGLAINATIERFHDYAIPNGQTRRSATSSSPELTYELTDPDDKAIKWRPSIGLSRQVGEDVRSGGSRDNKTVLSIGLKYN